MVSATKIQGNEGQRSISPLGISSIREGNLLKSSRTLRHQQSSSSSESKITLRANHWPGFQRCLPSRKPRSRLRPKKQQTRYSDFEPRSMASPRSGKASCLARRFHTHTCLYGPPWLREDGTPCGPTQSIAAPCPPCPGSPRTESGHPRPGAALSTRATKRRGG